jgi:hypothetical protein
LVRAQKLRLAATDLFVEKAQGFLTRRGLRLAYYGAYCAGLAFASLAVGVAVLTSLPTLKDTIGAATATVLVVRAAGLGAFLAGLVGLLIYLTRTLFHEASVMFNRRHSLRFGRLFVYLSGDPVTVDDLEKAFGWSGDYASAFLRMKHVGPQGVQGVAEKAIDALGKAATRGKADAT